MPLDYAIQSDVEIVQTTPILRTERVKGERCEISITVVCSDAHCRDVAVNHCGQSNWCAADHWSGTASVSYTHLTLPTTPYV